MKYISLANNKGYSIIDDEDYELISQYKWHIHIGNGKKPYAHATVRKRKINYLRYIFMHRLIMNLSDKPNGILTDHVNGNGLDNRRCNLRICNQSQNLGNSIARGGYSIYKGVTWHKRDLRWIAQITMKGKCNFIGTYNTDIEAARAYNQAATKYFGEFARLNQI